MSEEKKKPNSTKIILVAIGIVLIGIGVAFVVIPTEDTVTIHWNDIDVPLPRINDLIQDNHQVGQYECDGWLFEGNRLVNKYHPEDDIEKWEQKDRDRYVQLENSVLEYCVEKINDVPTNYKFCKDTFQRINELLDKMVEREINSLSEEEQEEYHSLYQKWHGSGCERLKGEFTEMIDNQT